MSGGIAATWIWWLVLLSGSGMDRYALDRIARTETQAKCEELRGKWLSAYSNLPGLDARLKCVQTDQKNAELNFFGR